MSCRITLLVLCLKLHHACNSGHDCHQMGRQCLFVQKTMRRAPEPWHGPYCPARSSYPPSGPSQACSKITNQKIEMFVNKQVLRPCLPNVAPPPLSSIPCCRLCNAAAVLQTGILPSQHLLAPLFNNNNILMTTTTIMITQPPPGLRTWQMCSTRKLLINCTYTTS